MARFGKLGIALFFVVSYVYPQYNGGNGTIIDSKMNGDINITIRKHVQRVQIASMFHEYPDLLRGRNYKNLVVYSEPGFEKAKVLFELNRGDYITIRELHRYDNVKSKRFTIWLKIVTDNGQSGFIHYNSKWLGEKDFDPYQDDSWTVLETIETDGKKWTIRKLEQHMSVWKVLDVRDKPGMSGTGVLFELTPPLDRWGHYDIIFLETLAITEEEDTIDGKTDHWVKIKVAEGKTGWVFGARLSVERGGPKYLTPENFIDADFYYHNFH